MDIKQNNMQNRIWVKIQLKGLQRPDMTLNVSNNKPIASTVIQNIWHPERVPRS